MSIFSKKVKFSGYCFFEVDGVLNVKGNLPYTFRADLVKNFCNYCKKYNYEPIIISSWREEFICGGHPDNIYYMKKLEQEFIKNELSLQRKLPQLEHKTIEQEIKHFLFYHPTKNYVIIDTNRDNYKIINEHHYFVNPEIGFKLI